MAIYGAFDIAKGKVDPATIYNHQRGAMVNWLWLNGVRVNSSWTYGEIRGAFRLHSDKVRLAEIEIEVIRQIEPDTEHRES